MYKYVQAVLGGLVLLGMVLFWMGSAPHIDKQTVVNYKTTALVIGSGERTASFVAEIADTPELQERGLSYRQGIDKNQAMLFAFPEPGVYQFWMKDMNFPIDIIWLDQNKKVVYIEHSLSPSTYPASFGPKFPTQYVIELRAGTLDQLSLSVGDEIFFSCADHFCIK